MMKVKASIILLVTISIYGCASYSIVKDIAVKSSTEKIAIEWQKQKINLIVYF